MAPKDGAQNQMHGAYCGIPESAMSHDLGSPQYVRYREMSAVYHKAKEVRKTMIERAQAIPSGAPVS